jgi:hypothetical protein
MTGTSTSTPTTVESAAPDWKPKRAIAVATANSKKLLAPINAEGPATHHSTQDRHRQEHNDDRLACRAQNRSRRDGSTKSNKRFCAGTLSSRTRGSSRRLSVHVRDNF